MSHGSFRFTLGTFECLAISDGALNYPLESFFANVPREDVQAALRQQHVPIEQITTPYTCFLVKTGQHTVLIDTGAGNIGTQAAKLFPSVDHATTITGTLLENMQAAGISPADVDIVVITHAHPDHISGTLDSSGQLVFPNAQYFIHEDEWEFWMSEAAATSAPAAMVTVARHNLTPLEQQLTRIADGFEILPGIRVIATPGHTPGHIALAITSGDQHVLHISDVVLSPLHLEHPTWRPVFDMLPEQAAVSKQRIFDLAAEQHALVFAHHFLPFPNVGYIRKAGEGWYWQPLEGKTREQ
jgi:glyoxylase-like metal-dependent hydrolase (beta-lactamase superfamily II)